MKYLKQFKQTSEYEVFKESEDFITPNVSYIVEGNGIVYNIAKTEVGKYKVGILSKKDISKLTYNMADLGLPSGTLWADRNVGAKSVEDYGTYFAWGETKGFNNDVKHITVEELCSILQPVIGNETQLTPDNIDEVLSMMGIEGTDLSSTGMGTIFTEKCFSSDWSDYFDTANAGNTFNKYAIDKLTVLQLEDDAARVNMGSNWRMPTEAEMQELIDNTTPTFIDLQGDEYSQSEAQSGAIADYNLKGVRFTGSNGNSIFIPAAGGAADYSSSDMGCGGILWLSDLECYYDSSNYANYLWLCNNGDLEVTYGDRWYGSQVRGVCSN